MKISLKQKLSKNQGFTLVELMLYFTVTSIILTVVVLIFMNLMDSRIKIQAHNEVNRSGRYAIEVISNEISDAFLIKAANE